VVDVLSMIEAPEQLLTMKDNPRLGGWAGIANDDLALADLATLRWLTSQPAFPGHQQGSMT